MNVPFITIIYTLRTSSYSLHTVRAEDLERRQMRIIYNAKHMNARARHREKQQKRDEWSGCEKQAECVFMNERRSEMCKFFSPLLHFTLPYFFYISFFVVHFIVGGSTDICVTTSRRIASHIAKYTRMGNERKKDEQARKTRWKGKQTK